MTSIIKKKKRIEINESFVKYDFMKSGLIF